MERGYIGKSTSSIFATLAWPSGALQLGLPLCRAPDGTPRSDGAATARGSGGRRLELLEETEDTHIRG